MSIWHERKADKFIEKLQEHLMIRVKVLRDTVWSVIDSREIVPADVVKLKIGTIVTAHVEILEENNLRINESALTGEPLPVEKTKDDKIFIRLYNYSLYRISESFRIIITIAVIGFIHKTYPLTTVQLIVLAFLNDTPIISLAFDKVKSMARPAHTDARKRFTLSSMFGMVGAVTASCSFSNERLPTLAMGANSNNVLPYTHSFGAPSGLCCTQKNTGLSFYQFGRLFLRHSSPNLWQQDSHYVLSLLWQFHSSLLLLCELGRFYECR